MKARELVIVGMSGGVDSSVAALLLLELGYAVQGLFMSNWADDEDGYCTAAEDFQDARRVCEQLGIALHRVDFSAQYRERVFAHFLAEYAAGRTPNPDVLCNREIKFGVAFDHARRLGADFVATGHYARIDHAPSLRLRKAVDLDKDQSYFLHAVPPAALARTLFPLGTLVKPEVRRLARDRGLAVHDKRDSTGICFIGERPFAAFLGRFLPAQPGTIRGEDGRVLGRHRGLVYYTLGQRKGLGIGGSPGTDAPWYVVGKDLDRNELVVAAGHDHPALYCNGLTACEVHLLIEPDRMPSRCAAKTRYRQVDQACTLTHTGEREWQVRFERPQRAATPGQYVVFYDAGVCLGGGVIASCMPPADVRRNACPGEDPPYLPHCETL
jgi:tRNA-uridine 2-sulfurtransferase